MPKVFLDAGHGGKDPGAIGNGLQEKNITLSVALEVGKILERHGITVGYTRTTDIYISLEDRANKANNFGADIFVSIHCNAFEKPSAHGVETYSHIGSTKGAKLAKSIHDEIIKARLYTRNRGTKTANFAVLRLTKMPAALIEMAFITNLEDAQLLKNKQKEFATAIAKGILSYFGIKYQEPKKEEPKQQKESGKLYKVQVGAFSNRENAEKLLKELKKKGYDAIVVADKTDSQNKDVIQLEYKGAVKKGTKGEHVKELQKALKLLGYYKDAIDGSAGPNTVAAIKAFQKANGLTVDGSAGPATYAKLNEVLRRL